MKSKRKLLTEEDFAKNEPPITANDLIAEIMPLLGDYFNGELSLQDGGILYSLPNGQKFILAAHSAA